MYVGPGPFAALLLPLIPFYSQSQLQICLIEFHQASVNALVSLIAHYGFNNYFDEILTEDAMNYKNEKEYLFDIIIVEAMQKALSKEPQVALTNHFSQSLAESRMVS